MILTKFVLKMPPSSELVQFVPVSLFVRSLSWSFVWLAPLKESRSFQQSLCMIRFVSAPQDMSRTDSISFDMPTWTSFIWYTLLRSPMLVMRRCTDEVKHELLLRITLHKHYYGKMVIFWKNNSRPVTRVHALFHIRKTISDLNDMASSNIY